ncbi:Nucleotide-sugar transporter [Carpediemonas membranifera]|uniref:Nucleotide-sugar transporter n=1 Tax=Carpediemonas membranifera TaxID=201153 RepID=A0A8J6EBJ7_9EUKA|nr:Nucleotide-sugar transporter [Carpediemonas membranifera]|eukprot:KAG9397390.1 Nucleotide-sugar transporter [Carpediemonas membranifera]
MVEQVTIVRLAFIIVFSVFVQSACSILSKMSQVNGNYEYSVPVSNFAIEVVKFAVASTLFYTRTPSPARQQQLSTFFHCRRDIVFFAIPSLIYVCVNITYMIMFIFTDPGTAQMLVNFKLITTAILSEIVFAKLLSRPQWLSLIMTFVGLALTSWPMSGKSFESDIVISFALAFAFSVFSACAGVSCEYVFKRTDYSLHMQNSVMYFYGAVISLITAAVADPSVVLNPFAGFNTYAILLVLMRAVSGLLISAVMKYADTITKNFCSAASLCATVILSKLIFDVPIIAQKSFAIIIIFNAMLLYGIPESKAPAPAVEHRKVELSDGEEGDV